jgi:hypothetical protein
VTIFISSVTELAEVEEALRLYEKAAGASKNTVKSKALATGRWRSQETVLGITYRQSVTILGMTFWGTIPQTTNDTLAIIAGKVRTQTQKAYDRNPNLDTIIQYIHTNCLQNYGIQHTFSRHPTYTYRK